MSDTTAPGARILYRDVRLDRRARPRFTVFDDNAGDTGEPGLRQLEANQQFRVELLDPCPATRGTTAAFA